MCGLAFLVGLGVAVNPLTSIPNQANAEEAIYPPSGDPTISLEVGGTQNGTATPVTVGETSFRPNTLTVTGKGLGRYTLYVNTAAGGTGELVGRNNPFATVGRIKNDTLGTDFSENTWGYAVDDMSSPNLQGNDYKALHYYPVPSGAEDRSALMTSRSNIKYIESGGSFTDKYTLVFAAKLGETMPADHYEANVYVSAIGDAALTTATGIAINGRAIYSMQDMTPDFCNAIQENANNTTLYDKRDDKIYFVSRLKDGNCWMTQNLDFDITESLLARTTDVSNDIQDPGTTKANTPADWMGTDNAANYYYDPGDYVYIYSNGERLPSNSCSAITDGFANAKCSMYFKKAENIDGDVDLHYHVGNYYSWSAATVRSGDSLTAAGLDATESICPKGWKLPAYDSFVALLNAYSFNNSSLTNASYSIYNYPTYFVYGGSLTNNLSYAGWNAYYRSSTTYGNYATESYNLYINIKANPSSDSGVHLARYSGISVRCVFNVN